jgi:hypothetical protein
METENKIENVEIENVVIENVEIENVEIENVEIKNVEIENVEIKSNDFSNMKLCHMCNRVQKFKVINDSKGIRLSGRKCVACTSRKNNEKLKAKGYYKNYYQQNSTQLKAADKIRYAKKKQEINLVSFD